MMEQGMSGGGQPQGGMPPQPQPNEMIQGLPQQ
jgi:hypothetical protein